MYSEQGAPCRRNPDSAHASAYMRFYPVAVRYAWGDAPLEASLVDGAGLPASPWRSDRWPLVTRDVLPLF